MSKYGRKQPFSTAQQYDPIKIGAEYDNLYTAVNDAQASASFATSASFAASASFASSSSFAASASSVNNHTIQFYESAPQTITSAGALTLAHGLGVIPTLMQVLIQCTSAEGNFSVGDIVPVPTTTQFSATTSQNGVSIVPDATNLNVRFGNATNAWSIPNKTTGAILNITNTKWNVIFRAWAF